MKVNSMANNQHLVAVRHINQVVEDLKNVEDLTQSKAESDEMELLLQEAEVLQSKIGVAVMKWTTRAIECGLEIDSELSYFAEMEGWIK